MKNRRTNLLKIFIFMYNIDFLLPFRPYRYSKYSEWLQLQGKVLLKPAKYNTTIVLKIEVKDNEGVVNF